MGDESSERPGGDPPLTETVTRAIAQAEGVAPEEVAARLYDVVDPDGLDRIFQPAGPDTPRQSGRLTFEVGDHQVVIEGGELVTVQSTADREPPRAENRR